MIGNVMIDARSTGKYYHCKYIGCIGWKYFQVFLEEYYFYSIICLSPLKIQSSQFACCLVSKHKLGTITKIYQFPSIFACQTKIFIGAEEN